MRLLVVEDDKDLNRQLTTALQQAGYVVDSATDGEQGHFLGDTEPYDAIILDIGLPKRDGISVLEQWRADGKENAGADSHCARPLGRQGAGLRRRRRRLCRQAVSHGGSAGAPARADASRRRPCNERTHLWARPARHEGRSRRCRWKPGATHVARIPAAGLSHAPHRTHRFAHGAGRTSLRSGFRPRFQYYRSLHRPLEKKLGVDIIQTIRGLGYLIAAPAEIGTSAAKPAR